MSTNLKEQLAEAQAFCWGSLPGPPSLPQWVPDPQRCDFLPLEVLLPSREALFTLISWGNAEDIKKINVGIKDYGSFLFSSSRLHIDMGTGSAPGFLSFFIPDGGHHLTNF